MDKIMSIVNRNDPFTRDHQMRVSMLSIRIGQRMALHPSQIENIRLAGLLHDIGKQGIPTNLLEKTGELDCHERNLVMNHPQTGYDMLEDIELSYCVKQSVLQHHERINGSGYPLNLTETQILMEAKIVAVADVIDAMAIHRPYNPTQGIDNALSEIAQNKGVFYDTKVVDACLELFSIAQFYFGMNTADNSLSILQPTG